MIEFEAAKELLMDAARSIRPPPVEEVCLAEAVGRVLAEDLRSLERIPDFDNSAMDGFAVRSGATRGAPKAMRVLGTLIAGDTPLPLEASGEGEVAWEIMTGAPFPAGFDACVRVEDTRALPNGTVEILVEAKANQNRRLGGEDFDIGSPVLFRGTKIEAEHLLSLSALGFASLPVKRRLRVGLISTGNELVPIHAKPAPGQIRNSNAPFLLACLRGAGVEAVHLGTVLDEPREFQRILAENSRFDLLLSTGAVSMGKADFVKEALEDLGAKILFHKVAIRPGKPILFAKIANGAHFFGLPGNPISALLGIRFFVIPFLKAIDGRSQEAPLRLKLIEPISKPEGVRCFFLGKRTGDSMAVLSRKGSFMRQSLEPGLVWGEFPERGPEIPAGTLLNAYEFHGPY